MDPTPAPAPTPSKEGCCTGYNKYTSGFCNGFDDGYECEYNGVCSWIATYDPEDCIYTEPPSTISTMPPAPTSPPSPGCCIGNSPKTWSFCSYLSDNEYKCMAADECTFIEGDPYDPECTQPTPEPTPQTTTQPPYTVPTKQPTTPRPTYTEYGCCTGYSQRTFSFCNQYTNGAECERAGVCSWISTYDESDCEPPTEPPSFTLPPAPTPEEGKGCCAGNSPRTWAFCMTVEDEYSCVATDECTWILSDDPYSDECTPPTKDPSPVPTPAPSHDDNGCCAGTPYDIHSWTYCEKFDNGEDCEASPVCEWNAGEYAECEPPTEPPSETEPPISAPTPSPTPGCCYSDGKYAAFCFSLEDFRSCTAAPNCDWEETDDYTVCEPPTPTPTTPAPVYEEGCCTGYSPKTYTFCSDFETGEECERGGVCSWIPTDDPDDCILSEPPSATMPPAPTKGPGCCTGNSPRTWSFCMDITMPYLCQTADECTWYEGDPYDPECTPPTPEPTPSTTPGEPTEPPTEEKGCCKGSTASSNTYCAAMGDNSKQCDAAPNCEWIVTDDPYDCVLTQPPNTVPTKQPTTPWPTYTEYGCCTGYSPRTYSFCEKYETGAECEGAGVCSWISTYDESDCEPPTEPPSFTLPPAPTPPVGEGCCAGNSPRTWAFCTNIDDEYRCVAADEC